MPVSDFLELMPHTVTFEAVTSRNGYGVPSYSTAVSYRSRVVYKSIRTSNRFSGQDVIATGAVWLAGVLTPGDIDDRVTLPDGSTPKILSWEMYSDEEGGHHTKLLFGGTESGKQQ